MAMKKEKARSAARKKSGVNPKMKASKTKSKKAARPLSKVALQRTVPTGKLKAELRHVGWNSVPVDELNPLLGLHYVVGQNIMLARVLLKKGCLVPEHSHPNEQLTFVLEGALKFWIDGQEIVVNAGEVLTIPPNMPHRAEALADTVDFDIFSPPRADWMNKTNSYLR
ncbi:MAG TPA: cupin domain-containing protein [Terriglobales bacterium]|nr:cupin domain-containing protein [Terriglobales bacterium]